MKLVRRESNHLPMSCQYPAALLPCCFCFYFCAANGSPSASGQPQRAFLLCRRQARPPLSLHSLPSLHSLAQRCNSLPPPLRDLHTDIHLHSPTFAANRLPCAALRWLQPLLCPGETPHRVPMAAAADDSRTNGSAHVEDAAEETVAAIAQAQTISAGKCFMDDSTSSALSATGADRD
jgi:hypothetical protein